MPLAPNSRLGPYEIVSPLGSGGMGEVYKARDTRLDRTVAIKVSTGPFGERFEREAKVISSLSHPNICTLFDAGRHEGVDFLVMEYLEGETLAHHLKDGPLPEKQAIRCAVEIAGALEAAHRKGVVHRDLKPANIMLTRTGAKLLDFGLAKPAVAASDSATQSLTQAGALLGTFPYMAPETLQGKEADHRSDIFAYGAVLYEMITGRRAFPGESSAEIMGAILHMEPAAVTGSLDPVMRRCLAKDPDERWQSAADVKWALAMASGGRPADTGKQSPRLWLMAALALILGLALGGLAMWARRPAVDRRPMHLAITAPPGSELQFGIVGGSAISPDGRTVAFAAGVRGLLWVRSLDSPAYRELPGTEGASFPFWSPDSASIGFFAAGKLKRIELQGGAPQSLCDAPHARGGSWSGNGVILFAYSTDTGLSRVPASGGAPTQLGGLDPSADESSHRWPQFLPGSPRYIFYVRSRKPEERGIYAGSLDDPKMKVRLVQTDFNGVFAPASDGRSSYLLWVQEQKLVAQRFDAATLRLAGEVLPVVDRVGLSPPVFLADVSVSANGILVHGSSGGKQSHIVFRDRAGKTMRTVGEPQGFYELRRSPDATRAMSTIVDPTGNLDLWQVDLVRGMLNRFTFDQAVDFNPLWSPDGRSVAFSSALTGAFSIYRKDASGAGKEERLAPAMRSPYTWDWSSDGEYILYTQAAPPGGLDLWMLPMAGERKPVPLLQTPYNETQGHFLPQVGSPRWIAYSSDESGRFEVYVRGFPDSGARWQVSAGGGTHPRWRADGKELFYLSSDGNLTATTVRRSGDGFEWENSRALFPLASNSHTYNYDVMPDGQSFLVLAPVPDVRSQALTVILNWRSALKE